MAMSFCVLRRVPGLGAAGGARGLARTQMAVAARGESGGSASAPAAVLREHSGSSARDVCRGHGGWAGADADFAADGGRGRRWRRRGG